MARLKTETPSEDIALLTGAPRPDLSVTDRKNRLFRLRSRLREYLKQELLPSTADARGIESEIRDLFSTIL